MIASELIQAWREEAERLRERYGDERLAKICETHARELEAALATSQDEVLTLTEAAKESGYSADHLGRLVAAGTIPNAGRKHAPGIRRRDLPARPGRPAPVAPARPGIASIGAHGRTAMRSRVRG